jgi:TPR repeat protein
MISRNFMKLNQCLFLFSVVLLLLLNKAAADETNASPAYEMQMLKAVLADADANKDNPELRKKYLNEFLTRSSTMNDLLDQTNVWIARAAAAMELDYPSEGWLAGQQLKRFGLQNSDHPAAMKVFAGLDRKNWLGNDCPSRDWSQWTTDQARTAANNGDVAAMNAMGDWYRAGQGGLPKDNAQAVDWYRKAAAQGNANAQNNLGVMYQNGWGVDKDLVQALDWFRKSAVQGNADAQKNLGVMYQNGWGVDKDYTQAVDWYRKAAAQGDAYGQENLAGMYINGWGVDKDYTQAADWYRKAAAQGNANAQNNLGVMYQNGQGVAQDYSQAVDWYRKAAAQGDAEAQNNLGVMYQNGWGVDKDLAQAKQWYQKAADQGFPPAKNALAKLNQTSQ